MAPTLSLASNQKAAQCDFTVDHDTYFETPISLREAIFSPNPMR